MAQASSINRVNTAAQAQGQTGAFSHGAGEENLQLLLAVGGEINNGRKHSAAKRSADIQCRPFLGQHLQRLWIDLSRRRRQQQQQQQQQCCHVSDLIRMIDWLYLYQSIILLSCCYALSSLHILIAPLYQHLTSPRPAFICIYIGFIGPDDDDLN